MIRQGNNGKTNLLTIVIPVNQSIEESETKRVFTSDSWGKRAWGDGYLDRLRCIISPSFDMSLLYLFMNHFMSVENATATNPRRRDPAQSCQALLKTLC
jgi:hypothetical protein